ncbi:MAG TPA: PKD domain-containing protein [Lacipirellula sp.]
MAARPRRPRRLARLFGRGFDAAAATRLQLSPRRLEARRMLDAAAPALALEMADLSSEYVQASSDYAPLALDASEQGAGETVNAPPANILIQPLAPIDENGIATLELVFEDADPLDSHMVEVDWGDGSVEVFNVSPGSTFFGTTHQYLDDDPSVTSSDVYNVGVKATDSAGAFATASAPITVNNVAPSNLQIAPLAPISENGIGELELTFDDPGTLDSHTVEVDWGDGSVEVFNVPQGSRFFGTTHQYLDDDPSGTSADDYTVDVRVLDDDGGEVTGSATINVSNVAPSNLAVAPIADVDENGFAQLDLAFDDPGTLDSHKVEVDWGDGTIEMLDVAPGARSFSATHQYLDDNPTGTASDQYTVSVRLLDDDLGEIAAAPATVTVHNVAPSGIVIDPLAPIDENGVALLNLTFSDPGTLDSHTVEIDWGDGSAVEMHSVPAGARAFAASHQYLDDNPSGTPADVYTISVKVRDDDGGMAMSAAPVTVNNRPPLVLVLPESAGVTEGSPLKVNLLTSDVGAQDVLSYTVDWGDGHVTTGVPTGMLSAISHTYADDGSYTINVTLSDDDTGVGTALATINVFNASPTLSVPFDRTISEGSLLSIVNIGGFTDPGFDNPLNVLDPANGGETTETFTYSINWGDGTAADGGAATIDMAGAVGVPTSGSFDGSHTYADNGVYTITVTVLDDDGGQDQQSFQVTVMNVAPVLTVVGDQTVNEGGLLSLTNVGTFTDPGFNNLLNPIPGGETAETFTYTIDWGDGTTDSSGAATIDVPGGVGVLTAGSFDGSHTYADNGVYTVTVTVFDDDSGQHQRTFAVEVNNVAPTLAPIAERTTDEGSLLTLVNVGQLTDPGFDNPSNPVPGGELAETFTYTVDWGDGTAIDSGAATIDQLGSPGVLTAASFDGSHTYADNGMYTVTVTVHDDDGGQVVQTFLVTINNVAPTLVLTVDESLITPIDEGGTTEVTITGVFSDPGFDNPNNTAGGGEGGTAQTEEFFTYQVYWGDNTAPEVFTLSDVNGSPGVDSTGAIAKFFTHEYVDNDLDNVKDARYTVEVTVLDDDGGSHTQTFEVIVYNTNPVLQPIVATAVNTNGETTLTLTFDDLGDLDVEKFDILIDWGDNLPIADPLERFEIEASYDDATPQSFVFTHTYTGPPDPLHPAADIVISVKIRDDDFGTATSRPDADPLTIDGQSNIETVTITNPGLGAEPFRIDTTPQVELLTFPERVTPQAELEGDQIRAAVATANDQGGSAGDSRAVGERFLELRVINPDGSESEGYRLRTEVLSNLQSLFRNLPDNRYAIYLVQSETNVRRLVIDVFVRNGKVIDPGDDSEGARDRPPTDESTAAPEEPAGAQAPPQELPADDTMDAGAAAEPTIELPARFPSSTALYHRSALAGVALALSAAGRDWRRSMEQTIASAKPGQWKRLRTAGHRRPRKTK